ncbi:hypothetical protein SMICM17S_10744 [Streptomyces microflavus]
MSQLRAPAARPDRREGGRHGRPGTRAHSATSRPRAAQPSPEGRIRPQLLRTALLPTIAALLSGAAAVIFTIRDGAVDPSPSLWAALGGSAALAVAAVAAAYLGAHRVAGAVLSTAALTLRRGSAQGQAELQRVVEQVRTGLYSVGPRRRRPLRRPRRRPAGGRRTSTPRSCSSPGAGSGTWIAAVLAGRRGGRRGASAPRAWR